MSPRSKFRGDIFIKKTAERVGAPQSCDSYSKSDR